MMEVRVVVLGVVLSRVFCACNEKKSDLLNADQIRAS